MSAIKVVLLEELAGGDSWPSATNGSLVVAAGVEVVAIPSGAGLSVAVLLAAVLVLVTGVVVISLVFSVLDSSSTATAVPVSTMVIGAAMIVGSVGGCSTWVTVGSVVVACALTVSIGMSGVTKLNTSSKLSKYDELLVVLKKLFHIKM